MDRMYRVQRHFYDLTRKYYLLGRDRLLKQMEIQPDANVLEAGCGTGRNLIILGRAHPKSRLFGLDASQAMLVTARSKTNAAGVRNIKYMTALADEFSYEQTFELRRPFDVIFFSYSLSMIPSWRDSIENALNNLEPDGSLYIVDFYDLSGLPVWFGRLLRWWLAKFHVYFRPEMIEHLKSLQSSGRYHVAIAPQYRGYSFIAMVTKISE